MSKSWHRRRWLQASGFAVLVLLAATLPLHGSNDASRDLASRDSWRVFRGDLPMTGVARGALSAEPKLLWAVELGSDIESTVAIADGTVYVATFDGQLHAVELAGGKRLWSYRATDQIQIQSSPAVLDGTVYFGDGAGIFHAVDAKSGKPRWTFETLGEIISSATFWQDLVVFGSYDQFLYALRRKDGSLAWKVETGGYVHATPAILGDLTTVSGCDGLLWLIRLRDGSVVEKIELGGQAGSTPAMRGNRAYLGTFENEVLGIDLEARKVLWRYEHPQRKFPYYASAAVIDGVVLIGGRDKIFRALDAETGATKWERNLASRIDSSAVVVGERAFVGTKDGDLLAVSIGSGETVWQYQTGSGIVSSPAVAAGRLVIGSLDGVLYCFG
jgi:outer membrane protein assembly factor BamB